MRLRIRVENRDYDVAVEFLDDAPASDQNEDEAKERILASVIRKRPPQRLPEDTACRSPIAGRVTAVVVPVGTRVRKNEPVILIEAMKMEIKVGPVVDGVIVAIQVRPGEAVTSGQVLFELS
jgi:biotin carboxyl carrier protein